MKRKRTKSNDLTNSPKTQMEISKENREAVEAMKNQKPVEKIILSVKRASKGLCSFGTHNTNFDKHNINGGKHQVK